MNPVIVFLSIILAGLVYVNFLHDYIAELLSGESGSVQPWARLEEEFDDHPMLVQGSKSEPKVRMVELIEPQLEELPTDPLAIAIHRVTLTPEQLLEKRLPPMRGALPGEILEEFPVEEFSLTPEDADEEHVHVRIED